MCGILGIATTWGREPSVSDAAAIAMRDAMAHRGPDGAGLWRHGPVVLAHRRLAVVDRSPAAAQPLLSADGQHAIVYNGELYNDAELRRELSAMGAAFRTRSDTETVLMALRQWGPGALRRMRGMFALAHVDVRARRLVLARDPLGIKPLYYAIVFAGGGAELVFASEVQAILRHPAIRPAPDAAAVSAYLTTIRTTTGDRTLFEGVRTLRAGEALVFDLDPARTGDGGPTPEAMDVPLPAPGRGASEAAALGLVPGGGMGAGGWGELVRAAVGDSVARHWRADVPVCVLLSGGLDSTVIAAEAVARGESVASYCAGAALDGEPADAASDRRVAPDVARALGTRHGDVPVTREIFARSWPEMVERLGVPLSTPNEVAIRAVCRRLREDGHVVALSGEGADELFGGYEAPLLAAWRFEAEAAEAGHAPTPGERAAMHLAASSWVPADVKPGVLVPEFWREARGDELLREVLEREYARATSTDGPRNEDLATQRGVQTHLRVQRRTNLAGLLARLDSASMLESVEGRTPLADAVVAAMAEGLPMSAKFEPGGAGGRGGGPARTKIALRDAYAGRIPELARTRPKASFPLPFQDWMADQAGVVREVGALRGVLTPAAIEAVATRPRELWSLAWPAINLALWMRRWWG